MKSLRLAAVVLATTAALLLIVALLAPWGAWKGGSQLDVWGWDGPGYPVAGNDYRSWYNDSADPTGLLELRVGSAIVAVSTGGVIAFAVLAFIAIPFDRPGTLAGLMGLTSSVLAGTGLTLVAAGADAFIIKEAGTEFFRWGWGFWAAIAASLCAFVGAALVFPANPVPDAPPPPPVQQAGEPLRKYKCPKCGTVVKVAGNALPTCPLCRHRA